MAGRPRLDDAIPANDEGRLRARVLALTSIAIAWAIAACGLTADFSGLQGGTLDAGASDAGVTDVGAGDAPVEAPGAEAGTDGGKGFCASLAVAPKLCADFDEGLPVDTGWTLRDATPSATVDVDTIGFSPPGSMKSAITPADVPGSARLQQAVPVLSNHVHVEFEMLLPTGGGPFELAAIHEVAPNGNNYGLFYKQEQGNLLIYLGTLEADGGLTQLVVQLGAPPSTWLHVAIDFDIGPSGSIVVKHDGAVVVNQQNISTATADRTQLFVELGFFSPNGATAHANFDDVIVDWP